MSDTSSEEGPAAVTAAEILLTCLWDLKEKDQTGEHDSLLVLILEKYNGVLDPERVDDAKYEHTLRSDIMYKYPRALLDLLAKRMPADPKVALEILEKVLTVKVGFKLPTMVEISQQFAKFVPALAKMDGNCGAAAAVLWANSITERMHNPKIREPDEWPVLSKVHFETARVIVDTLADESKSRPIIESIASHALDLGYILIFNQFVTHGLVGYDMPYQPASDDK